MKIIKKILKIIGIIVAILVLLRGLWYIAGQLMKDELKEISSCLSKEEEQHQNETTEVMKTLDEPERRIYFCERDTAQLNRLVSCYISSKEKYPISFFVASNLTHLRTYFTNMVIDHNKICPDMQVEIPSF